MFVSDPETIVNQFQQKVQKHNILSNCIYPKPSTEDCRYRRVLTSLPQLSILKFPASVKEELDVRL